MDYWSVSAKEATKTFHTGDKGLTEHEARQKLKRYGANEIKEGKKISPLEILISQFKSVVIWILIAAVIISAFLQEYIDAAVIVAILVLIAVIGFVQEYRAEKSIEALKKLASSKAFVIRDGRKIEIDAKEVVPGDIIFLETGDKVPADARLVEIFNLQAQESILTGESQPVKKITDKLPEKTSVADRKNMVYAGTIIVSGKAKAVVVATGMQTEIGKIAHLMQETEAGPTPLQKHMDKLGKWLGAVVIGVAAVVLILGVTVHETSFLEMLIVSVSLAVAAIPEGLPAVVTISLALGTRRMLKRNALVRRLPSVETLGSTTVICTDKTGTLTVNEMTVKKLFVNGKVIDVTGAGYETTGQFSYKGNPVKSGEIELLLRIGALNNDADLRDGNLIGDPTEGALIVSAAKVGLIKEELELEYPRIDEIEFTSERKIMTTIHKRGADKAVYVKGASEVVLKLCKYIWMDGKANQLTEEHKRKILKTNKEFADHALRVLGFAYKNLDRTDPEKNLVFVGLQAMIDPPREEVKKAIRTCKKAGIKVIMITGDHEITAKAVAREIGLEGRSLTGQQLNELDNLEDVVEDVSIFARVNPEHKIKIISALKKRGHVVAMTGDGVNDAPALKKADIGIAMGVTGSDVAKEASDMILTDDNFTSIVNAVEEGRGTYDNIKKYFSFLLSGNIGEVMIIFLAIVSGMPLPLTATQILLINLVTDGLPALALSADPFEPNSMSRKPRKQSDKIYKGLGAFLVYYPVAMTAVTLAIFGWFLQNGSLMQAQTAAFLTIGMFELYQAFACRSTIYPAAKVGFFKNRYLVLAVLSSFAIMVSLIFIPSFGKLVGMIPLDIEVFIAIAALSSTGAIIIEISKHLKGKTP